MIKATELRIGNLIHYLGEEIVVTMVGEFGIQSKTMDRELNAKFRTPDLTAIPLTEQWLLDFGFTQTTGWDGMVFWKYGNQYTAFVLEETEQGYTNSNDQVIPSVHLLQNAYFFDQLDGSELTLKTV